MEKIFQALWYHPVLKPFSALLLPLSVLYWLGSKVQYWWQRKQRPGLSVPVVVIGNLTTGGSGKTPVLITLTQFLQKQGLKVGIISRGYKSEAEHGPQPVLIHDRHSAREVGDEPLLIFHKTHAPVAVHADRPMAAQLLLQTFPDLDVIFSDDALQHARLDRDIEIVVINARRGLGNRFLLPAGPLRESTRRLQKVDFCIINGDEAEKLSVPTAKLPSQTGRFNFTPKGMLAINSAPPFQAEDEGEIHAVAGIADPTSFFKTLQSFGLHFTPHFFPDHHAFTQADFKKFRDKPIVMTEKDAIKCQSLDLPKAYALEMTGQFDSKFLNAFLKQIRYTIDQKRK